MKKKYIVMTPSYNENSGGIVVLHKLCDLLNRLGYEAYVMPYRYSYYITRYNFISEGVNFLKWSVWNWFKLFRRNESFDTPIYTGTYPIDDEFIVVYPEVVLGNPLGAKNVIRWLLHQPGYHEGVYYYSPGELLYKFNSAIHDFEYPGSKTSEHELKIIHYPTNIYFPPEQPSPRDQTAYCVRKGKGKNFIKDHSSDILIDDLNHSQVAEIFRASKYFISYDTHTAYSTFAVLCGCISVVVPDDGVSVETWYPNEEDRFGIAYGLDNVEWAVSTAHKVRDHIFSEENKVIDRTSIFAEESQSFFSTLRDGH
jgi:hypothetical protein